MDKPIHTIFNLNSHTRHFCPSKKTNVASKFIGLAGDRIKNWINLLKIFYTLFDFFVGFEIYFKLSKK